MGVCQTDKDNMGACGGQKEKPEDTGEAPANAPSTDVDAKNKADLDNAKDLTWMSNDLKGLMHDYFNRYDLDGSQTINSSEELKQLCTNLVVKLDLPMDVADIDKVVGSAGPFEDDAVPAGDPKPEKGSRNEWNLETFVTWLVKDDCFKVDKDWASGDQSDEEEEPNASRPFLTGTYVGVLEGDGKKYTVRKRTGGTMKDGELVGYTVKESNEFTFKIRTEDDGTTLKPRPGCDAVGLYTTSGSIDGTKITMHIAYEDLDNDKSTEGLSWCWRASGVASLRLWTSAAHGRMPRKMYRQPR